MTTERCPKQCTQWPCVRRSKDNIDGKMCACEIQTIQVIRNSRLVAAVIKRSWVTIKTRLGSSSGNHRQALIRESVHTWLGGAQGRGGVWRTRAMEVLLLLLLSFSALPADVLYCDRVYQLHDRYANTSTKNCHVNTPGLTSLRPLVCGALDSERSRSF